MVHNTVKHIPPLNMTLALSKASFPPIFSSCDLVASGWSILVPPILHLDTIPVVAVQAYTQLHSPCSRHIRLQTVSRPTHLANLSSCSKVELLSTIRLSRPLLQLPQLALHGRPLIHECPPAEAYAAALHVHQHTHQRHLNCGQCRQGTLSLQPRRVSVADLLLGFLARAMGPFLIHRHTLSQRMC